MPQVTEPRTGGGSSAPDWAILGRVHRVRRSRLAASCHQRSSAPGTRRCECARWTRPAPSRTAPKDGSASWDSSATSSLATARQAHSRVQQARSISSSSVRSPPASPSLAPTKQTSGGPGTARRRWSAPPPQNSARSSHRNDLRASPTACASKHCLRRARSPDPIDQCPQRPWRLSDPLINALDGGPLPPAPSINALAALRSAATP